MMSVVAIDGPAGSGKSTVARLLASDLNWSFLDTGAMYRAVTALALRNGINLTDLEAVGQLAATCKIETQPVVTINGIDVSSEIREAAVNEAVSVVAANSFVRAAMVDRQREWAYRQPLGTVVEGRDIGTVVFPDATLKVFLTADLAERERRRQDEGAGSVARRDAIDSSRSESPLRVDESAIVIDTTNMSIQDVVKEIRRCLKDR